MNGEQVKSSIRSLIIALAGALGGFGVAKGWYSSVQLESFVNSEFFGGIVVAIITGGYGVYMNRQQGLINATAAAAPQVTIIASKAMAAASPAQNVVAPNTPAAKDAAVTPIPEASPAKKVMT